MSSRNRIPPILQPYLRLPPETSLILFTGTLGCNISWLTARFVSSLLNPKLVRPDSNLDAAEDVKENAVVLASFMADNAFWKNEIKRITV